jgi:2-polyprenyl-3-methyl-5-hydroxy-6-metoxy-1,4-benzoquinol methylase
VENKFIYIKDEPDYLHLQNREVYQALYDEVGQVEANKAIKWRGEWMKYFQPEPRSTILELGAHNGPNLIHYGRLGHFVTGVEISNTLIATFEKFKAFETADTQKRINMIQQWIEDFYTKKKYDYVLCTEILEHVADPVKVLKTAHSSIKKSGFVYISSPLSHWGNNTHVRGVPPQDLEKWLHEARLVSSKMFVENNERTFCIAHKYY